MKITNILLEVLDVYRCSCIVKVDKTVNRTDIFNQLRALPYVVIVEPENNDYLASRETDQYGFSLLTIKFLGKGNPVHTCRYIKKLAIRGSDNNKPIKGLIKMLIKTKSIDKV